MTSVPVHLNPITRMPFTFVENIGDSRTVGIEIGASGRFAPAWNWDANYTWQMIWDDIPLAPGVVRTNPELGFAHDTPRHKLNARLGYSDGPWEADLAVHYSSAYAMPDFSRPSPVTERRIDDLVILVPRIGCHLNDAVMAEVSAEGLWERRETTLSTLERRVLFSVVGRW